MPKANDMIVQVLEEAGIEYLFGIPGGGTGQIYDSLFGHDDKVRTILARHEQSAAIMADAYGRATGKPAAIMGQGLFMGSNAGFGIMEAFLSSTPMLVLTIPPTVARRSTPPTSRGRENMAASTCIASFDP